jgi:5-formyltetrahydrofolate cyclo-ligase
LIDLTEQKRALRGSMRERRRGIPAAERASRSARIAEHVMALETWREAQTVMLYLALPEEVHTEVLAKATLESGKRLCLPRVREDGTMEAVQATTLTGLGLAGLKRIWQPLPGVGDPVDPQEIDLDLVPCVGVDRRGVRLGLGGGHYDRFIPWTRPHCLHLGLIYQEQLADELPLEEHDVKLRGYVWEEGLTLI